MPVADTEDSHSDWVQELTVLDHRVDIRCEFYYTFLALWHIRLFLFLFRFLFIKILHSNLNSMSLVAKIEIKWIEKEEIKESFQPPFSHLHRVLYQSGHSNCP